jgi:putative ABC transport system substrate-binding protein
VCALLEVASHVSAAYGEEVVLVRDSDFKVHGEALEGFRSGFGAPMAELDVGDKFLTEEIRRLKPRLIVAVGYDALSRVREIKDIPVVFFMALNAQNIVEGRGNITGVDIALPVERQLEEIRTVLPRARRIGVVYDPRETGYLFEEAVSAASESGLSLVGRPVERSEEVIPAVNSLLGRMDVLWMFPDITVINYETVKYMMFFSYENKVPIYAFSEKYVKNSALMATGIDVYDIGRQAAEMAIRVLNGEAPEGIPIDHPRKVPLFLNMRTADKLGVTVPEEAIEEASKIYGTGR